MERFPPPETEPTVDLPAAIAAVERFNLCGNGAEMPCSSVRDEATTELNATMKQAIGCDYDLFGPEARVQVTFSRRKRAARLENPQVTADGTEVVVDARLCGTEATIIQYNIRNVEQLDSLSSKTA